MAEEKKGKRFLELQMEELMEMVGEEREIDEEAEAAKRKALSYREEDAEIAGLYADVAEYEQDLKCFEAELEVIKNNELDAILPAFLELTIKSSDEDRDYADELKEVLVAGWKNLVEYEKCHPEEELAFIKANSYGDILETFRVTFPEYVGEIEVDIKAILTKRWAFLVQIKKEHIKEEISDLKIRGLKPHYAERVYKRYHGLK